MNWIICSKEPEAVVVFSAEDGKHVIELTIFSGTTIFRVVEKTSDMLVSIDAAVSSIRRQLREHRSKLSNNINSDAFEKDADELIFIPEVDRFDEPAYQVVRSKQFEFGPMSVQEAILQMNRLATPSLLSEMRRRMARSPWCIAAMTDGILVDKT